jgi:hypothetical protein
MMLETSRDDYLSSKFIDLDGHCSMKLIQRAFNTLHLNITSTHRSNSVAELNRCTIRKHLSIRQAVMLSDSSNTIEMQSA